uniref:Uncharacterized protein n=1 Tax=Oryza brachyantha TaxID=4533 RepID=J3L2U5_ORYBR
MAASFLRPLLPSKPFLSTTPRPYLPASTPATALRCTVAPKPVTGSTPKPSQDEANNNKEQEEPNASATAADATPDEAGTNPHRIPDDETPPSATATTSFAVARRVPSAISPDRRQRRTALTQGEPPNYEIGWKRTKELPLEKPKGWAIADFMEKLEGLMARGRYGSGELLGTVAGVVTEEPVKERVETARARCRQAILVALSL